MHTFICKNCGKDYQTKYNNRNQFCSKECAYAYKHALKLSHDEYKSTQQNSKNAYSKVCPICGKLFESTRKDKVYCSRECAYEAVKARSRKASHAREASVPRPICTCRECGVKFVPEFRDKHRSFCSKECECKHDTRHKEIRRRTKKLGIKTVDYSISLDRLAQRDKGICYLCGEPIDYSQGPNGARAPSIDHVIPLTKGGEHTWDNVKLAHRCCNAKKGDKTLKYVG